MSDTELSQSNAARKGLDVGTGLRRWPAAVLLVVMICLKVLPAFFESPPLSVTMASVLGPAAVGVLLVGWWLFASRAGIREKLIGLASLVGIIALGYVLLHPSLKGMPTMVFPLPTCLAAFAAALLVVASHPRRRLACALAAAALGFAGWAMVQADGVTGSFAFALDWRWNPSAEERYLNSLAARSSAENEGRIDELAAIAITREDAQWPDFRGQHRDGVVLGVVLSEDWDASPPKLVWRTLIGPGWSSFTVAGRRLFTQEQRGEDEAIVCMDADTGDVLWSHTYPARFYESVAGAGPRGTPTIGDGVLFALGGAGQLTALNAATGELIWSRQLREDAGREPPTWGWSSSPLIAGDGVIVHAGGADDKGVIAYDIRSGEPMWSVASGDHSYSSAQSATFDGVEGCLMMTNEGLQFLDSEDGSTIWNHSWPSGGYRAIQPLVIGNRVLIAASQGEGTRCIEVTRESDQWVIDTIWTSRNIKPDFNDYVVHDGYIYGFDANIMACVDVSTGERAWKRGRYGNGQLIRLADAGQLLVVSESGELVLVKASPEKLIELAKFPAIDGKTWNHPVLVGSQLFLRNGQEAACYELPIVAAQGNDQPSRR